MSRYTTHNGQPFSGQLLKIKIQSCHFDSKTEWGSGEEQIIEISLDGTVRLAQKGQANNDARKYSLSRESTIRIFEAFSEVFGKYVQVRFRPVTGYWKVRLLGEENEVFLYRGVDGEDYTYKGEELTDILRNEIGINDLFAFSSKPNMQSGIASIDIQYNSITDSISEHLTIDGMDGSIAYNRSMSREKNIMLRYDMPNEVAQFLDKLAAKAIFVKIPDAYKIDSKESYQIFLKCNDGTTMTRTGSFSLECLPSDWNEFTDSLKRILEREDFGRLFGKRW